MSQTYTVSLVQGNTFLNSPAMAQRTRELSSRLKNLGFEVVRELLEVGGCIILEPETTQLVKLDFLKFNGEIESFSRDEVGTSAQSEERA